MKPKPTDCWPEGDYRFQITGFGFYDKGMLRDANVEFRFAPEGVKFFEAAGWRCAEIKSTLRAEARIGSFMFRVLQFLFERGPDEQFAWSAICRFVR